MKKLQILYVKAEKITILKRKIMKNIEVIINEVLIEMRSKDPGCKWHVEILIKELSGGNIFYDPWPIVLEMERRNLIQDNFNGTYSLLLE